MWRIVLGNLLRYSAGRFPRAELQQLPCIVWMALDKELLLRLILGRFQDGKTRYRNLEFRSIFSSLVSAIALLQSKGGYSYVTV
jgi:hypothetical protein